VQRVFLYVLPDPVEGFLVADDMLVVIPLPDLVGTPVFAKPFGHTDFEATNDRTNCFGGRPEFGCHIVIVSGRKIFRLGYFTSNNPAPAKTAGPHDAAELPAARPAYRGTFALAAADRVPASRSFPFSLPARRRLN
jgi:hypothetical protein